MAMIGRPKSNSRTAATIASACSSLDSATAVFSAPWGLR